MADEPSPSRASDTEPKVSSDICRNAGFWAVIGGLLVLVLVAGFAIFHYSAANDAVNVIAAVGTVLGALVGAFFGVHVGASAGAQAQQNALNKVQATNQQAIDAMQKTNTQSLQMAVSLDPGSDAAHQLLANLQ